MTFWQRQTQVLKKPDSLVRDQTFIEFDDKVTSATGGSGQIGETEGFFLKGTGKFENIRARWKSKWTWNRNKGNRIDEWGVEHFSPGFPGWLLHSTDYIGSFPPFSNLPTQYRITIDDQQKWFGQGGFESLAVSWLFPGKIVQIDAPCLDCGLPIRVEMKDGVVQNAEPDGLMGYTSVPFRDWFNDLPYAGSTMNLFRSEEHVRNWSGFKPDTEDGINQLSDVVGLFSINLFTMRLDTDYASRMQEYLMELIGVLKEMGPFWQPPEQ